MPQALSMSLSPPQPAPRPHRLPINSPFSIQRQPSPRSVQIAGPSQAAPSLPSRVRITGATAVNFDATSATSFFVNSSTMITAISPAHAAGTVDVTVTTPSGTSATSPADQFTYFFGIPSVTLVSPNGGPIAGSTVVNITGTNFTGTTAVNFGSTPATSLLSTQTLRSRPFPLHMRQALSMSPSRRQAALRPLRRRISLPSLSGLSYRL